MKRRLSNRSVALILALCCALGGITTLFALDTSSALYTANIQFINLGITRQNFALATEISGGSLVNDGFMASDALNAVMHEGSNEVASMPPNNRIVVQDCIVDDGGSFTDWQAECQDSTELDFPILPASPAVDDAVYFACDNPCRIITVNIGQEAVADTLTVDWEYYNGTSFVTASNVDDRTFAFTKAGTRSVSFDMPSDMATTSVTGSAVSATYWVRAKVTAVSNPTQQAIGTQAWYENGQWWAWGKSQNINQELLYSLSMGGPDLVTHHQLFVGDAGIVTPDHASVEMSGSYTVHFAGDINFTAGVTGSTVCVVCKAGAFALWISDTETTGSSNALTLDVTGSGSTQLTLSGIPDATASVTGTTPHILDVVSDGTDVTLSVDGVGSTTGTAQFITDTANDWQWGSGGGITYSDTIYILPDDTSLAFAFFDSEADWDTGSFSNTVSTAGQPNTELTFMVDTPTDDGRWIEVVNLFQNTQTAAIFGSNTLGFGVGSSENSFFRFDNVAIPAGSTVTSAYLEFIPQVTQSGTTVNATIAAIADADANAPSSFAEAEGATRTSNTVGWNSIGTFSHASHVSPTTNDSPDITDVVQEVIDLAGWASGNAIVIFVEDNGSTNGTGRFVSTVEEHHSAAKLHVTLAPTPVLSDDFIELTPTSTTPRGWTRTCGTCNGALLEDDTGSRNGIWAVRPNNGPSGNSFDGLYQDIAASAGEVWSASAAAVNGFTGDNGVYRLYMTWLNSGLGTISETSATVSKIGTPVYDRVTINGETAPANTAWLRLRLIEETCGVGGCSGNSYPNLWDSVIACECATAPTFPDSQNVVVNPGLEQLYENSGTWTSPSIALNQTDVLTSSIIWDSHEPSGTTLTVETSIDGGSNWSTATNGGGIPGISEGQDVSGLNLNIRVTMEPNTGDTNIFSPVVSTLAVIITDDIPESSADLYYQLRTTPGVTVEDLSPNSNDGTMSYPVQLSGIFSFLSPFQSNLTPLSQDAAIGTGDFAAPVTGSGAYLFTSPVADSNLPLAGLADTIADLGYPREFFWAYMLMIIGLVITAGLWVFSGGNPLFAGLGFAGTMTVAAMVVFPPGWVIFVMVALLASVLIVRSRLPI